MGFQLINQLTWKLMERLQNTRMQILLTAGLREQNINVTQLWPGILKFSQINCLKKLLENKNCKRTLQDTNGSWKRQWSTTTCSQFGICLFSDIWRSFVCFCTPDLFIYLFIYFWLDFLVTWVSAIFWGKGGREGGRTRLFFHFFPIYVE